MDSPQDFWNLVGFIGGFAVFIGAIYIFVWLPIRLVLAIIHRLERR